MKHSAPGQSDQVGSDGHLNFINSNFWSQ